MANNETEGTNFSDLYFELASNGENALATNAEQKRTFPSSRAALPDEALKRVLTPAILRKVAAGKIRAFTVIAPTTQWLKPLKDAVAIHVHGAEIVSYHGAKTKRSADGDEQLAKDLAGGRLVIGIATAITHLPAPLVGAADATLVIQPIDAILIKRVIRRCMRGRPGTNFDALPPLAGLDFDEVCACVPAGASASLAVPKLLAALATKLPAATNNNLPQLEEAAGYGAARDWGLDLKRDIDDLRAGKIGWSEIDRGVVLHGPPGTGKTLFAQILGQSCGLPTIVSSVADFFGNSPGDLDGVIKELRNVFDRARAAAPCILFLDELDAIPNRAAMSPRGRDWWTPVITDFLLLLDSAVAARDGVIVVGATNRIQDIDLAILRPGRLERAIFVGPPQPQELVRILRHYLGGDLIDQDLTKLAYVRDGATGAEAMEWARAARRKARRAGRRMTYADLEAHVLPTERPSPKDLRRAAIHEAGHAVAHSVKRTGTVERMVLSEGSRAHGQTFWAPERTVSITRSLLENIVVGMLAGRAAEAVFYKSDVVAGSGGDRDSDLARATALVAAWHTSYGLGGSLVWTSTPEAAPIQLLTDNALRAKVERDLEALYLRAVAIVEENRDAVAALAEALESKGVLLRDEIELIAQRHGAGRCT